MAGRIERGLKRLGHAWLRHFSPPPGKAPEAGDLASVSRILVVRLDDRLGNVVLLTPLLSALRTKFPAARVSLVLARRYWDMRSSIAGVDEFIPFERRELARNPFRIRALLRQIRAGRYDLAFDAADDRQTSFNHLLATALSGARFRIGHDRGEASRYYEVAVPVPDRARHAARMHVDLLRALVAVEGDPHPALIRPSLEPGRFREKHGIPLESPLVLLHPGGRGPKRWTPEAWGTVASRLHGAHGVAVGLVWGPADADAAREVIQRAGAAVTPIGILPLAEFLPAVCLANVFLSGDCGPMHVASALGTPVVAVFLVSDAEKYRPLGDRDEVFDARNREFGPEEVVGAVMQIVDGKLAARGIGDGAGRAQND